MTTSGTRGSRGILMSRDILLKVASDEEGTIFKTIAGMRPKTIVVSGKHFNLQTADSSRDWSEVLRGQFPGSVIFEGYGVFKDRISDALTREIFFAMSARIWQLVIPEFGRLQARFLVAELSYGGDPIEGEITFSIKLQSLNVVEFTPL